jgi:Integrase zinc binding domain
VDPICKKLLLSADKSLFYDLNEVGILVRKSPFDGSQQIVVPQSLVSRILYLEHSTPAAGDPGAHRMLQTIRKTLLWPRIGEDVYETVRKCDICARNRIREKENEPAQDIPRDRASGVRCHRNSRTAPADETRRQFYIGDQRPLLQGYQTVPLRTVTALSVARALCDHWAYVYGPPVSLLTDNGLQFTAKVLQAV